MRRWVHVPFVVCCLAVLSSTVTVAQNTQQLFQPINVQDSANLGLPGVATWTPGATTQDDAKPFQLEVPCALPVL